MVFGALIGAGASLLGMDKEEHAADRMARQAQASRKEAMRFLREGSGQFRNVFNIAKDYLTDRIGRADSALATAGAGAHRDIRATHARSSAEAAEAMRRRGFGGTSAAMAAQAHVAGATAATMGDFWDQFGRTRAAHEMQAGGALSGLHTGYADSLYAQKLDRANVMLGRQATAPTGQSEAWGKLGGAVGGALDEYLKGPSFDYAPGGKYEGYHETEAGPMGPLFEG